MCDVLGFLEDADDILSSKGKNYSKDKYNLL